MDSDKFIMAMAAMAVVILIVIGSGFVAVGYIKNHPEVFQIAPKK